MTQERAPRPMPVPDCDRCDKIPALCVCDAIQASASRVHVLVLQHPQEPDKDLGSAKIANLSLPNSTLRVGLSWPNLAKALGRETTASRWAVLHLGSGIKSGKTQATKAGLHFIDKNGALIEPQPSASELDGIVVLDGTWSQAKTLWWRNAWLLKLKRAVLIPSRPSLYKELRREPRGECLSTIESIAESLDALGEPKETGENLRKTFSVLLDKRRALPRELQPKGPGSRHHRRYRPQRKKK